VLTAGELDTRDETQKSKKIVRRMRGILRAILNVEMAYKT
jgi:hypothetical protein